MKKIILLFTVVLLSLQIGFCQKDSSSKDLIYSQSDAQYPGGFQAYRKYIDENLKVPKKLKRTNIQGKVTVEFIVEKDGTVSDVKSVGKVLDEEAVRLVKENPTKWIPAQQNGKAVRLRKTLPVSFKL
jgi:periplasmic protein TonB